jgi:uncharacterized protein (DUF736 family)
MTTTNTTERDNNMTGVLFTVNEKKSDKHPDLTGRVEIDGKKFSLSGWNKTSANGNAYVSLSLREWVDRPEGEAPVKATVQEVVTAKKVGRPKKTPSFLD